MNIKKYRITLLLLLVILITVIIFSLILGRYTATVKDLLQLIFDKVRGSSMKDFGNLDTVLFKIRIPRTLVAVFIGVALSTSGACYQGLFKNPMVSPAILGASSGACLGASIAILMDFNKMGIQVFSFLCGLLAVALTYGVSMVVSNRQRSILILVLSGMVTESLFSALMSILKYIADSEDKLPEITFWLMGSLASVTPTDAKVLMVIVILAYIPLYLLRWKLNVLSCGEEEAMALGMDIKKNQGVIIFASTLLAAASVSIAGRIGWIGLIVPHIARLIVGPNYKYLIPISALIGGIFLLIVDDLARSLVSVEIPLGILTSLCGTPFFFYLLLKGRKSWV